MTPEISLELAHDGVVVSLGVESRTHLSEVYGVMVLGAQRPSTLQGDVSRVRRTSREELPAEYSREVEGPHARGLGVGGA